VRAQWSCSPTSIRQAQVIRDKDGDARAIHLDLVNEDSIRNMIESTVKTFGRLDVLVNNAAATQMAQARDGTIEAMDAALWDLTMQINLRGPMLAIKHAVPYFNAAGGGSIINLSSGGGLSGATAPTAYGVSKAGVIMLTQYAATQLGKRSIRCNAIAPGLIVTPATESTYASGLIGPMMLRHHLTPRLGRPEDIGWAVVWLASDESSFVTGQTICVDGGFLAHQPFFADEQAMTQTS
jgi:NAD(P)-dependent dehydrogenase (short-subunit alcohol dehydrogenase family)